MTQGEVRSLLRHGICYVMIAIVIVFVITRNYGTLNKAIYICCVIYLLWKSIEYPLHYDDDFISYERLARAIMKHIVVSFLFSALLFF